MADTLTTQTSSLATIPTSSIIATDDAGAGGHVQIVKLAISTDGSATPLTADNTNGMLVNLGTNNDVTLATLPDTAAGDLAAINTAVSGTLTVGSHAVTNAGTFAVQAAQSGTWNITNVSGTISLPTGAATAANQSTTNTSLSNLETALTNVISTNNSTTTPLAGDAAYTGTGEDVSSYAAVSIQIDASHNSATNGMTFQFSTDNTNWDDVYTFTYTASDGARRFQFPVTAQYFRVVYTNGSTLQTHFRVQTILHAQNVITSVHRLGDDMNPDRSANVIKSVLFAQAAGSGNFTAVDATASGNLKIAIEENDAGNLTTNTVQLGGTAVSVNTGTVDAGTQRVTLATDVSLPAGTNAIGKLAANSGVDIGDVDVTSMPGTAAEAAALPSVFVVVAGDDGTDTHPIQLDASGHLQVDIAADSVGIGGGTQYTEDDAAAANPVGNALILVRQDTPATLVSLDGDNVAARATNYGAQFVQVVDSSGNFINSFGGSGGTAMNDDSAFTPATDQVTPAGYLADMTTPDAVDEGDIGAPRMTLARVPLGHIWDAAGNERGANVTAAGELNVIASAQPGVDIGDVTINNASIAVTNAGTFAVQEDGAALTALQLIDDVVYTDDTSTHATGSSKGALFMAAATPTDSAVDANDIGAVAMSTDRRLLVDAQIAGQDADVTIADGGNAITVDWNGTAPPIGAGVEATALRVTVATDSTGVLSVDDNGGALTVDNAGTFAVQVDGAALTALQLIDDVVYIDDADWTADTSSHALVGGVTQTVPTANTDGDVTPLITNVLRELRTAALESDLAAAGTSHVHKYYTAATPTDGIIWSPAAGKRWYVTHLSINVSAASTVTIEDDKAGGDDPVYKAEFAANSGVVLTFPDVPLFSGEDAADLTVTASAGTVYVTAVGYEL